MRTHSLTPSPRAAGEAELEVSRLCLGAMDFGTKTGRDESYRILDRYAEAGGNLLDTANCYAFWAEGGTGDESETLIGAWLADRGQAGRMKVASKVGAHLARPDEPYSGRNREGLSAARIREQADRSRERLGVETIDLYYPHCDDRSTDQAETVEAFAALVADGTVGTLAASNHATWRLDRARSIAAARGLPTYRAVQLRHTYLYPRPNPVPVPEAIQLPATDEMFDYIESENLALFAYSPLSGGAFDRDDRGAPPAPVDYDHPGSTERIAVLRKVAVELGVKPGQLVLAWMMSHRTTVIPILGVSSVDQLDMALAALEIELDEETLARLNAA
ncbi:aldo/keto reductase [Glycomyces buryatensis]|uniref:Aldo/keto reductase n=1 Tax=Glycomyces buryatensis TaxID=2570927 RepID=A0A4S8QE95_9ACTN|nr:aldo/keto reductase [Glycomyces buryatensis]THV42937.1 aldo/keto reductase [Glycomyces buryatensis]